MVTTSQNHFSRTVANDGKLGAYYTDLAHCRDIAKFLEFGKTSLILEPAIGNGAAVKAVTNKETGDSKFIFGVELNSETYKEIKEDPDLEVVLNADALHGTKITNTVFPFCFSNPPYGEITDGKNRSVRLERLFAERIFTLMRAGGILVYVIPEYVLTDEGFTKAFIGRFEPLHVYRFRKPEYDRFKQCVFIGKRRTTYGWTEQMVREWLTVTMPGITDLPEDYQGDKIVVPDGYTDAVKMFTTAEFHPEEYLKYLGGSSVINKIAAQVSTIEPYGRDECHPPIKLKKNHLYLLAVSGEGQGLVGDEDEGTLHLQRGSARRVSKSSVKKEGDKNIEVVTTSTQITMKVVESDGTITLLQ